MAFILLKRALGQAFSFMFQFHLGHAFSIILTFVNLLKSVYCLSLLQGWGRFLGYKSGTYTSKSHHLTKTCT